MRYRDFVRIALTAVLAIAVYISAASALGTPFDWAMFGIFAGFAASFAFACGLLSFYASETCKAALEKKLDISCFLDKLKRDSEVDLPSLAPSMRISRNSFIISETDKILKDSGIADMNEAKIASLFKQDFLRQYLKSVSLPKATKKQLAVLGASYNSPFFAGVISDYRADTLESPKKIYGPVSLLLAAAAVALAFFFFFSMDMASAQAVFQIAIFCVYAAIVAGTEIAMFFFHKKRILRNLDMFSSELAKIA